jgi:adenylosuccinate lyase
MVNSSDNPSGMVKDANPQEEMKAIFSYETEMQLMLDFEVALARAQAGLGIIPREAADEIRRVAKVENIEQRKWEEKTKEIGHPFAAFVRLFKPLCKNHAGEFFHLGVTSQDLQDTVHVLRLKKAHRVIYNSLRKIEQHALDLAEEHAGTIMAGRTHAVHASPITFGYKMAIWAREIRRHIHRMQECYDRIMVGHVSDAVGTMASMGEQGPEIERRVLAEVGLGVPDICWQAARDRQAEFANLLAIMAGSIGRLAREVNLLSHTEISEVSEPWEKGKVGSSAMPHKRNPDLSEFMLALTRRIINNAQPVTEVMVVDHERELNYWLVEQACMIESLLLMGELLTYAETMIEGLLVFPERMRKNLDILKGLIVSEKVMLELGWKIGKQTAYEIVYDHAQRAISEEKDFREMLSKDQRIKEHFTEADIDRMLDPAGYIGLAKKMTFDAVRLSRTEREQDRIFE